MGTLQILLAGVLLCLITSYYRCFFHIPLSPVKPLTVDAASVTPQDPDRQIDISFDTKVRCSLAVQRMFGMFFDIPVV